MEEFISTSLESAIFSSETTATNNLTSSQPTMETMGSLLDTVASSFINDTLFGSWDVSANNDTNQHAVNNSTISYNETMHGQFTVQEQVIAILTGLFYGESVVWAFLLYKCYKGNSRDCTTAFVKL